MSGSVSTNFLIVKHLLWYVKIDERQKIGLRIRRSGVRISPGAP